MNARWIQHILDVNQLEHVMPPRVCVCVEVVVLMDPYLTKLFYMYKCTIVIIH